MIFQIQDEAGNAMPVNFAQTVRFLSDTLAITNQPPNGVRIDLPAPIGFSALISDCTIRGSTQLCNWQTATPSQYNLSGFNPRSGIFTAPSTGIYSVKATIYYMMSAVPVLTLNCNFPFFSVRNVDSGNYLISGLLPVLRLSAGGAVGELRAILDAATVTLADNLLLHAGDNIALTYESDGLNIPLELGAKRPPGIVWSVARISNA